MMRGKVVQAFTLDHKIWKLVTSGGGCFRVSSKWALAFVSCCLRRCGPLLLLSIRRGLLDVHVLLTKLHPLALGQVPEGRRNGPTQ